MYPKLRAKFGDSVAYDVAPREHLLVEFAFDVLLVANGGYKLQAYHDYIGFKVAKPLLERAFTETYGLEMKDLFLSEDLAIGTYRRSVASTIPNVTKVAWEHKQDEILKGTPGAVRDQFILTLPRTAYEREYGKDYRKPSVLCPVHRRALQDPAEGRRFFVRWRSRCLPPKRNDCFWTASPARGRAMPRNCRRTARGG